MFEIRNRGVFDRICSYNIPENHMTTMDLQHWVIVQLIIDLFLVGLIVIFFRNLKTGLGKEAQRKAADQVIGLMEPLLQEAEATTQAFDAQLREKNRLINSLNERLDSRIISLNLLLNRAENYMDEPSGNPAMGQGHVYDQQQSILELFQQGAGADEIASRLSLPRGEVELVLDLKKKFLKL